MNSTAELPYELHTHGSGAFVTFKVRDEIALPLIALARATLRAIGERDRLALEFHDVEVEIEGRALALMLEHLLAGRVKRISPARDDTCEVASIRIKEAP